MSAGNGDGKKDRFIRFHDELGRPEFAPEFFDSLVAVMADGESCLGERVFAWSRYRAWGNSKKHAIHIYAKKTETPAETRLGQADCAMELAWLEAGNRAEWLDAPLKILQKEMERCGIKPVAHKTVVSRAFQFNVRRDTIAPDTGWKIEPVVSPSCEKISTKVAAARNFEKFRAWRKVARPSNFEEWEVARERYEYQRKVERAEYFEWLELQADETPEPLPISSIILGESSSSSSSIVSEPEQAQTEEEEEEEETPPLEANEPTAEALQPIETCTAIEMVPEVPTYPEFKSAYPVEKLDDAKASREFAGLPALQKTACMYGLLRHLKSERWIKSLIEDQGRFIPQASKFIRERLYEHDPPPYFPPKMDPREQRKRQEKAKRCEGIFRRMGGYELP